MDRTSSTVPVPGRCLPLSAVEDAKRLRAALFDMIDRLAADYCWVPTGQILAIVAVCRSELLRTGLDGDALLEASEAMTRARLEARIPRSRRPTDDVHLAARPLQRRLTAHRAASAWAQSAASS